MRRMTDRIEALASKATRKPRERTSEQDCAVEATVAVIGSKWKPILLFHLLGASPRYSELDTRINAGFLREVQVIDVTAPGVSAFPAASG